MKNIFTEHPKAVGEGYFEHFGFAWWTGFKLISWGLVALIHGVFPFLFKSFVSTNIKKLHKKIISR